MFTGYKELLSDIKDSNSLTQLSIDLIRRFLYRDELNFVYEDKETTLSEEIELMSKNITDSLASTNEKTLEELNKTLLTTNKFLSMVMVLLLVSLVLAIALFIGKVIEKILTRNVF